MGSLGKFCEAAIGHSGPNILKRVCVGDESVESLRKKEKRTPPPLR
jgi:hypothetical protein